MIRDPVTSTIMETKSMVKRLYGSHVHTLVDTLSAKVSRLCMDGGRRLGEKDIEN